jgi:hypothetical protein
MEDEAPCRFEFARELGNVAAARSLKTTQRILS